MWGNWITGEISQLSSVLCFNFSPARVRMEAFSCPCFERFCGS